MTETNEDKAERFVDILNNDEIHSQPPSSPDEEETGCSAMVGLKIIAKYLPKSGITGAEHDMIYGATLLDVVEAGLTEEDVIKLRQLNWYVDGVGLACYV